MELSDFKQILEATGYPVAYYAFPEGKAPPLPFICYFETDTNNFFADGVSYQVISVLNVELYSKNKDVEAEKKVEEALKEFGWNKTGQYINSEKCYETIYELEV